MSGFEGGVVVTVVAGLIGVIVWKSTRLNDSEKKVNGLQDEANHEKIEKDVAALTDDQCDEIIASHDPARKSKT